MSALTRNSVARLIVACGDGTCAASLHQESVRAQGQALDAAMASIRPAEDGTLEVSLQTTTSPPRTANVAPEQAAEPWARHIAQAVRSLRQRPNSLPLEGSNGSAQAMDVIVLVRPDTVAVGWAVETMKNLSRLPPLVFTGGVRLCVIAPPACRDGDGVAQEDLDVVESAASLAAALQAQEIPWQRTRILAIDLYDRQMRCLAASSVAGFVVDLLTHLIEPPLRIPFLRFAERPVRAWSETVISAGFGRLPNDARWLRREMLQEVHAVLLESWFGTPNSEEAVADESDDDLDQGVVRLIEQWQAEPDRLPGLPGRVGALLRRRMAQAEAHLRCIEAERDTLVDPDLLGFPVPLLPPKIGWLRRLLSRMGFAIAAPKPRADPWADLRKRHQELRAGQQRARALLARAVEVQEAILSLRDSLETEAPDPPWSAVPRRLRRAILDRCGITPCSLAKQAALEPGLRRALFDPQAAPPLVRRLDRWALDRLGIDPRAPLTEALCAVSARTGIPAAQVFRSFTHGLSNASAAFYHGPFDPARYQRRLLLAHPAEAEAVVAPLRADAVGTECFPWNRSDLVGIELLDGLLLAR